MQQVDGVIAVAYTFTADNFKDHLGISWVYHVIYRTHNAQNCKPSSESNTLLCHLRIGTVKRQQIASNISVSIEGLANILPQEQKEKRLKKFKEDLQKEMMFFLHMHHLLRTCLLFIRSNGIYTNWVSSCQS